MKTLMTAGMLVFALTASPGWSQDLPDQNAASRKVTVDAIYPEESRIVIDDMEYYVVDYVLINGQEIPAGGVLKVLREGQVLTNIVAERQGQEGVLVLKGADIL